LGVNLFVPGVENMNCFKKKALAIVAALVFAATTAILPDLAYGGCQDRQYQYKEFPAEAMAADLIAVRPLAIASTIIGCTLFVAALPFTVWSGERIERAGRLLVIDPGYYTFVRPLGEFD